MRAKWRRTDGVWFPTTCYKCRLNPTERMGAWIWQGGMPGWRHTGMTAQESCARQRDKSCGTRTHAHAHKHLRSGLFFLFNRPFDARLSEKKKKKTTAAPVTTSSSPVFSVSILICLRVSQCASVHRFCIRAAYRGIVFSHLSPGCCRGVMNHQPTKSPST